MAYFDINSSDYNLQNYNEVAIQTSVLNILNTRPGEVPGLPEFGSKIQDLVFNLADIELEIVLKNEIKYVLKRWEPRIEIIDVFVNMDYDYNRVGAKIEYKIKDDIRDDYSSKFIVFSVYRN